mmetsp:Transcript_45950/g.147698  ORF Transcript_45950/g.147698 Transcript_45950/m.147698 type:complete len:151 (-) Transcript_45950:573-1025(-)
MVAMRVGRTAGLDLWDKHLTPQLVKDGCVSEVGMVVSGHWERSIDARALEGRCVLKAGVASSGHMEKSIEASVLEADVAQSRHLEDPIEVWLRRATWKIRPKQVWTFWAQRPDNKEVGQPHKRRFPRMDIAVEEAVEWCMLFRWSRVSTF